MPIVSKVVYVKQLKKLALSFICYINLKYNYCNYYSIYIAKHDIKI